MSYQLRTSNDKRDLFNTTLEALEAQADKQSRDLPAKRRYSNANIIATSKQCDPTGKGLEPTYWSGRYPDNQARVQKLRGKEVKIRTFEANTAGLKQNRDLNATFRRYMRTFTRADATEYLIGLEQRVLSLEKRLKEHDEAELKQVLGVQVAFDAPSENLLDLLQRALQVVKAKLNTSPETQ